MAIIQLSNSLAVLRFPLRIVMLASLSVLVMLTTFACGTSDPVAQENASDQASSAGIKVHGDWTITVLNPDGGIANTYEFENDLHEHGSALLIHLLAGNGKIENHTLYLSFLNAACEEGLFQEKEELNLVGNNAFSSIYHYTIPASIVQNYHAPRSLMLSGFCTIETSNGVLGYYDYLDRELLGVATRFETDEFVVFSGYSPSPGSSYVRFTEKIFGTPGNALVVTNGQKMAFNVKLTFD